MTQRSAIRYATSMVTRIHKSVKPLLYLAEHREHRGISAEQMAGRLGIERESLYRWEREPRRLNPEKQVAYAEALGIEAAELWFPPTRHSLDALLANQPDDVQAMAADIVKRLVGRA
jgi:transcriptional regulator with XRE-family HTH domain